MTSNVQKTSKSDSIAVPSTSKISDIVRAETEQQKLREMAENEAQNENSSISVEPTTQNTSNQPDNADDDPNDSKIDLDLYEAQCRINLAAVAEIDLLKEERRGILTESNKVLKERDVWKIKYDRLLERFGYLQKKLGKENEDESEREHSA